MNPILFSGFKMHPLPSNLLASSWKKRSLPKKANNYANYYLTTSEIKNLQGSKSLHYGRYELN